jgi:hypothetical protein
MWSSNGKLDRGGHRATLFNCAVPDVLERGAEAVAHLIGDVGADAVHAGHRVAATIHLDHPAQADVFDPGRVRTPVGMRPEFAGQVRPGAVGQAGYLRAL